MARLRSVCYQRSSRYQTRRRLDFIWSSLMYRHDIRELLSPPAVTVPSGSRKRGYRGGGEFGFPLFFPYGKKKRGREKVFVPFYGKTSRNRNAARSPVIHLSPPLTRPPLISRRQNVIVHRPLRRSYSRYVVSTRFSKIWCSTPDRVHVCRKLTKFSIRLILYFIRSPQ